MRVSFSSLSLLSGCGSGLYARYAKHDVIHHEIESEGHNDEPDRRRRQGKEVPDIPAVIHRGTFRYRYLSGVSLN